MTIQGTGFLPRLRKMRKTCGPRQTLECCGSSKSTITSGRTMGNQPACLKKSGMSFFSKKPVDNITAHVCFCRSEFTGLTTTRMTRGDELPRHMIPESEWPRFLQATVAELAAILGTSTVTIISRVAAKDIRKHLSHRIVPSRHVYREKPGEGVGAASKAKCRWCVLGLRDPDIGQLERSSPTPQTSPIYTFLFVAAVLQREVTLGDLKSAFMQSDKDLSERPQGQLYASLHPGGIPLADGTLVEEGSLVQPSAAVIWACQCSVRPEEDDCAWHSEPRLPKVMPRPHFLLDG